MTSTLCYRVHRAIIAGTNTTAALAVRFGETADRIEHALRHLRDIKAIRRVNPGRKVAVYAAIAVDLTPEGRGKQPGSATGRSMGNGVSAARAAGRKRSPLPSPKARLPIERCWPSAVRVSAWR